jgi:hypothetical protein
MATDLIHSSEWSYQTRRAQEVHTGVNQSMKMPSYLKSKAKVYGCIEELKVVPETLRPQGLVPQDGASLLEQCCHAQESA